MKLLIADDKKEFAEALRAILDGLNHEVVEVVTAGGLEAIRAYRRLKPDLLLMDYMMPNLNGATACRHILSRNPGARVVLMSGADMEQVGLAGTSAGAVAVLQKPFTSPTLQRLLERFEHSQD